MGSEMRESRHPAKRLLQNVLNIDETVIVNDHPDGDNHRTCVVLFCCGEKF